MKENTQAQKAQIHIVQSVYYTFIQYIFKLN